MIFSWQEQQWQKLWQAKQDNRLPHALLFAGIAGTGKHIFAKHFTLALLCQQVSVQGMPCEKCHACRLVESGVHPNVMWVTPEKEGQAIKVDQIRDVSDFINQSSLQGIFRIVVINPADYMNTSAANALLKTLEEPSSGAIIVLISDQPSQLPATVLSRCQRIAFARPSTQEAVTWLQANINDDVDLALLLKLANGAPLAVKKIIDNDLVSIRKELFTAFANKIDPIKTAVHLKDADIISVLDLALSWLSDLIRLQLVGNDIVNTDYAEQLQQLTQQTQAEKNTKLLERILHLRTQVCNGINFNKQLLIEDILIRWCNEKASI